MTSTYQQARTYGANRNAGPGIPSRALNPGLIQYSERDLTSAEVLTLNASPVEVVPAPGAGQVLEFVSAVLILDYGTATYASNGVANLLCGSTKVSTNIAAATLLHQANDAVVWVGAGFQDTAGADQDAIELEANAALKFSVDTGEVDTGNSPVRIKVAFRVHATGL